MPQRTPMGAGVFVFDDYEINYIIDNLETTCDYLVVWGGLPSIVDKHSFSINRKKAIFVAEESHLYRRYNSDFLRQFDIVFGNRIDIVHPGFVKTHELNTWHMGRSLDEALSDQTIVKNRSISIVCSNLTDLPGHKNRFAFANQLKGHFKDKVDFFGTAFTPLPDKWDALAPYKYSIAIENASIPGYFSEKLTECYLAHCLPIYFGAPDIEDYFPANAIVKLKLDSFNDAIRTIESLLESDPYEHLLPCILQAKQKFLNEYHFFSFLNRYLINEELKGIELRRISRTIRGEHTYERNYRVKQTAKLVKNLLFK